MSNLRHAVPRSVGVGLACYGLGTAIPFLGSGAPGGSYSEHTVTTYLSAHHFGVAAGLWYVGALSAIGLLVAAVGLRTLPRSGGLLAGLAQAGATVSIAGAFVSGGVAVAAIEGGDKIRAGAAHPVIYTITEIGNLLAVCAPALCVGVGALIALRAVVMPGWLRAFTLVAGVCGILAPFFFTYFVYVLWTVVVGLIVATRRVPQVTSEAAPSLV
jgi:hypothetical protein